MLQSSWQRLAWCVLAAIPGSLFAVDGVILIDQNRAVAGNVTPGDTPGFPVTISQPGSYRLTGNLTVSDANTTAIQITSDSVILDLNGFSIGGPAQCAGSPAVCPAAANGTNGTGVLAGGDPTTAGPRGVKILNGTVRGMGGLGIFMTGEGSFVQRVTVDSNAGGGMVLAGTILDSTGTHNGGFGLFGITVRDSYASGNTRDGIVLDGSGGVGTGNISSFNGGRGMLVPNGTVTGNTLVRNNGFGMSITCPSVIIGNTIIGNAGGILETSRPDCVILNNATRQ